MKNLNALKNRLIPLVFFVIAFVCFSIPVFLNNGRLFSTDQEVFIRAAENIRTRFSFVEPSPLNEKFHTSIIDAKENFYVSKHRGLISQYPPAQSMILALLRTFIPNYNLVECFIGAWGIVFFYLLVKRLLGKQSAIFGAIGLIFTPIYFFWSMFALADITAFVVILLTILTYLKAKETNKVSFYIMCSLFLGVTVWVKYPNMILIVPFFIHYVVTRKKGEKLSPALGGVVVFCICILLLLFYHKWAFGGFLTTGYNYNVLALSSGKVSGTAITKVMGRLVNFPVKQVLIKITNFPIHIAICSPLTLLGIFGCFSLKREDWKNFSLLLLISLFFLAFYLVITGEGFGSENYHRSTIGSYNRYILPTYCLLMIPAALFFRNLSFKKFCMVLILITISNISSLSFATINSSNLHWLLVDQKETYELQQKHLKLTSDESVIIGAHIVFYMVNTNRHFLHCKEQNMQSPIFRNELIRVVPALLEDGQDVYLVRDCGGEIDIENISFELIDAETDLYKLKKLDM